MLQDFINLINVDVDEPVSRVQFYQCKLYLDARFLSFLVYEAVTCREYPPPNYALFIKVFERRLLMDCPHSDTYFECLIKKIILFPLRYLNGSKVLYFVFLYFIL